MSSIKPNSYRYLCSLAAELKAQTDRVRDLIGSKNWLADGHHKEYLLGELLRRHLPDAMLISRGFVVSPVDPELISREQDLIIVDTLRESPVFRQGGLIITFPRAVRAVLSVKTTLGKKEILNSVEVLNSARGVGGDSQERADMWCGAYFFDCGEGIEKNPGITFAHLREAQRLNPVRTLRLATPDEPVGPDVLSSADNFFFRTIRSYMSDKNAVTPSRLLGYRCHGLATALFMGELLDHLAASRGAALSGFSQLAEIAELSYIEDIESGVSENQAPEEPTHQ